MGRKLFILKMQHDNQNAFLIPPIYYLPLPPLGTSPITTTMNSFWELDLTGLFSWYFASCEAFQTNPNLSTTILSKSQERTSLLNTPTKPHIKAKIYTAVHLRTWDNKKQNHLSKTVTKGGFKPQTQYIAYPHLPHGLHIPWQLFNYSLIWYFRRRAENTVNTHGMKMPK